MGGATKFAILKSQGAHRRANTVYTHTLVIAAAAAVVFMAAGLFGAPVLAALLGAKGEIAGMTATYLRVLLLFSPAFLLNDLFVCFVRNDGAPSLSMAATVVGSLANVVMDYIFIFPCGLGIFGAVLATGFSPVIGICIQAPHWAARRCGFRPQVSHPNPRLAGQLLGLGVPALLEQLSGAVVMITFNALILRLAGNTGVAAYGVVANLSLVVLSVYTGIAQGQPAAGQPGLGPGPRGGRAAGAALCAVLRARLCGGGLARVFLRHGADRGDLQQRSRPRLAAHGRAGAAALLPRAAVRGGQRRARDLLCLNRAGRSGTGGLAVARCRRHRPRLPSPSRPFSRCPASGSPFRSAKPSSRLSP